MKPKNQRLVLVIAAVVAALVAVLLAMWGLRDRALLPVQLESLHEMVDDLALAATPDAGHFIPWEHPAFVIAAIRDFIAETA